jgi:hypothetical protein
MSQCPSKRAKYDKYFVEWMKRVGKHVHNGRALLDWYVQSVSEWPVIVRELSHTRQPWWPFLRGRMPLSSMRACKDRYLDLMVFVCGNAPAEPWVGALFDIEEQQFNHRADSGPAIACQECQVKALIIEGLKTQLRECAKEPAEDADNARLVIMRDHWDRNFIVDCTNTIARNILRKEFEEVLQERISRDEVLIRSGTLWSRFCKEVIRDRDVAHRPFRCRHREEPLPAGEIRPILGSTAAT